ncbi:hypothetical protein SynPROS91_00841 [Synechococcus sp. PROS-9-1]|nr:hypothetical protein SynPROS91_00841 [Synechococcus sp. PROS-9-1]
MALEDHDQALDMALNASGPSHSRRAHRFQTAGSFNKHQQLKDS